MCEAAGEAHLFPLENVKSQKGYIVLMLNVQYCTHLIQLKIVKWSP